MNGNCVLLTLFCLFCCPFFIYFQLCLIDIFNLSYIIIYIPFNSFGFFVVVVFIFVFDHIIQVHHNLSWQLDLPHQNHVFFYAITFYSLIMLIWAKMQYNHDNPTLLSVLVNWVLGLALIFPVVLLQLVCIVLRSFWPLESKDPPQCAIGNPLL